MAVDFIIVHGSPGNGKTTLSKKLHEHYESPYFEFGWIPEFRMLAPSVRATQRQEEQLSFENLIAVAKNYNRHGYKNVILTDLDDARMLVIPEVFAGYNYVILTLYVDQEELLKRRILSRDNGNGFKDWEQSINTNRLIQQRAKLPNEYRILNSRDDADVTFRELITIVESHVPVERTDTSAFSKDQYFSYISDD
ncbi:hypothetical protein [Paenibacillus pinihumi]|uniref:hypothetical protein n=1 Tax=Paenibacillus pinihumi TaxID=669462 RepID=UPI0004128001|nr:hypothetical protein [Paenibacillus pinihumi]